MNFLGLTDDAILHIVKLLHDEPLLGLVAVVGLHRCQHRLRTLLQTLANAKELRERAGRVTFDWELPVFSSFRAHSTEIVIRSRTFCTALGHSFRLMMFPNGNQVPFVSVYLEVSDELSARWSRRAMFTLTINSCRKQDENYFCTSALYTHTTRDWGYSKLFALDHVEDWLSKDGVLQMSVDVTVEPPPLSFQSIKSVLRNQRDHVRLLRNVLPLMITDLQRVLAINVKEEWLRCSECDGLLVRVEMPKHTASKTRSDRHLGARVKCSTEGCECCAVATAHALLRSFVAEHFGKKSPTWQHWRWPTADRAVKPEDFALPCIITRFEDLHFQGQYKCDMMKEFSADLDKCLSRYSSPTK